MVALVVSNIPAVGPLGRLCHRLTDAILRASTHLIKHIAVGPIRRNVVHQALSHPVVLTHRLGNLLLPVIVRPAGSTLPAIQ